MLIVPPGPASSEPKIAEVPAGIVRLLADRGKAFVDRNRPLLGQTLAPGPFAERQLRAFDNLGELAFATFSFRATTRYVADAATPRVRALHRGKQVVAYHVIEESAVHGVETEPYVEHDFFTFVRDEPDPSDTYDGWRLASDADFEPLGVFSAEHLWDAAPVAMVSSPHFVLLTHPDMTRKLSGVLDIAEKAYDAIKKFWPRPIGERYVVIAPSTTEELGKIIQATFDLSKFVAFASGTERREDGWAPGGVRMFLQIDHFLRYNAAGKQVVLAHELLHAVTRPVAGPFMPVWLEEGLAMHASEPEHRKELRRVRAPDAFPTDDAFFLGSTRDILNVYYLSQSAVAAFAERYPAGKLADFYEALGKARVTAGTEEYHLRDALSSSVGWTVEEWTAAWRDRVARG